VKKNCDDMLSRFHLIGAYRNVTDRQTDRQTDRFPLSISRVRIVECTISSEQNVYNTLISLARLYAASNTGDFGFCPGDRDRNTRAPGKYGRSGNHSHIAKLTGSTAPAPQKLGEQPLTLLPLFRRPCASQSAVMRQSV